MLSYTHIHLPVSLLFNPSTDTVALPVLLQTLQLADAFATIQRSKRTLKPFDRQQVLQVPTLTKVTLHLAKLLQ